MKTQIIAKSNKKGVNDIYIILHEEGNTGWLSVQGGLTFIVAPNEQIIQICKWLENPNYSFSDEHRSALLAVAGKLRRHLKNNDPLLDRLLNLVVNYETRRFENSLLNSVEQQAFFLIQKKAELPIFDILESRLNNAKKLEAIRNLVEKYGCNVNEVRQFHYEKPMSPLEYMFSDRFNLKEVDGFYEIAEFLIEKGIKLDPQKPGGLSPLHYVVSSTYPEAGRVIELLIKNKADINYATTENVRDKFCAGDSQIHVANATPFAMAIILNKPHLAMIFLQQKRLDASLLYTYNSVCSWFNGLDDKYAKEKCTTGNLVDLIDRIYKCYAYNPAMHKPPKPDFTAIRQLAEKRVLGQEWISSQSNEM